MAALARYDGRAVALLTQHGKQAVIAPVLEAGLGCRVRHVSGFDTDRFGSFTGETARAGSQLEAARRKARKGMELAGTTLGIASEGSFGPDPVAGLIPWNIELVLWLDDELGLEVVGMAQGAASSAHLQSGDWAAVAAFAEREGFGQQQLVLRPDGAHDPRVRKGLGDWAALRAAFDAAQAESASGQVWVELDLRAFAHPRRMQHIAQAADDLLQRLRSPCPACQAPGFWISARQPGLPCAACARPTAVHRSELWSCGRCGFSRTDERTDLQLADPGRCGYCNP